MARLFALLLWVLCTLGCVPQDEAADLVLFNGEIYTMNEAEPWAKGVVITGNQITAVLGEDQEHQAFVGPETRVVDLKGRFVTPGFIDGHTHFNRAGALLLGANLLEVSDDDGLRAVVVNAAENLGKDAWLTGGFWGAYEQWSKGSAAADEKKERWMPSRDVIDKISPDNPCLLNSYDRALYLANSAALRAANLEGQVLDGMMTDASGKATGLMTSDSPALERIRSVIPEKPEKQWMREHRAALKRLAENGVVEIHDIVPADMVNRYVALQKAGDLTARVLMRADLSRGAERGEAGYTTGLHPDTKVRDRFLRYGPLKGYVDGIMGNHSALFYEPYDDQPENFGRYRHHTSDEPPYTEPNLEKLHQLITTAYRHGFVTNVHAIGTRGVAILLDQVERLAEETGSTPERFRVIHAQVIRPEDFPRFQQLGVIAEVNPYHLSDDMRWMEERIGTERCKGAYAFKSLLDNGAMLSFASDWPGTNAAWYYSHPKYLLHAAVNRTTLGGEPNGGWFPEQKITMHEALKAYTINNAYAAGDEDTRGSIEVGKLADLTVCDRNLMTIDPKTILNMEIEMTVVDGKIVYERVQAE